MALKLRFGFQMRSHVHEIVRRLMELAALEERLSALKRDGEKAASVTALIESLRANISVGVLINHDRMRNQGRLSVAEVRHGVCSGCHIALAIGNAHEIKTGSLRRCGNCGRYLYVAEEESEPAPGPRPDKPRRNAPDKSTATRSQVK